MKTMAIHGAGRNRRGWSILVLLIVVVIILIVVSQGPMRPNPVTQVTQMQSQIDRSDQVAVAANIQAMQTQLQMMEMADPGRQFTIEEIRQRLQPAPSRSGGEYLLGPDGRIYHTGYPDLAPPPELLEQMISLERAEP